MKRLFLSGGIVTALMMIPGCRQTEEKAAPTLTVGSGNAPSGNIPTGNAATGSTPGGDVKLNGAQSIHWVKSMDAALKEAGATKKPIMVDFYATWCGPCKVLDEDIYTDDAVIEQSRKWVSVKIDVEKNQELASKYNVTGLPTIAFLKPDGTVITGFKGVPAAAKLAEAMESSMDKVRAQ